MKVKLKSKMGRPFWRFGVQLSPDEWTDFDLSDEQLASIREECILSVAAGGALEIRPNPWAKETAVAKEASGAKDGEVSQVSKVGGPAPTPPPKDPPKGK